jgi:hypothetical protein
VSFRHLQDFSNKYGGDTLKHSDLCEIFKDFRAGGDTVTFSEFLTFFAKISSIKTNNDFDVMIKELQA